MGDHLWSVGKNTSEQQEKKVLEAGLQSLPAVLFAFSQAEWDKAAIAARQSGNLGTPIHPRLRKVTLITP